MTEQKILPEIDCISEEKSKVQHVLVLHNDDVNLFEHVIESLIDVCGHTSEQAEQCALLAHMKGKCDIKHGEYDSLEAMKDALNLRYITATIEQ